VALVVGLATAEVGISRGSRRPAEAEGDEMSEIMRTAIKVPEIAGVSKLSIGRWFKRVGDPVATGEPLVEIETDNLTHEKGPATGILSKVLVRDGGSVEPASLCEIDSSNCFAAKGYRWCHRPLASLIHS
jgi:2-oxoglutarate dehydrogenase E2 component (dihydrolipoamide succinyltransferase)